MSEDYLDQARIFMKELILTTGLNPEDYQLGRWTWNLKDGAVLHQQVPGNAPTTAPGKWWVVQGDYMTQYYADPVEAVAEWLKKKETT